MGTTQQRSSPGRACLAGIVYFAGVFVLAFLFGMIRLMLLVPLFGELLAVCIEVPIILTFSWLICRRIIDRFEIPAIWQHRLLMGIAAFAFLLVAEFALSVAMFGNSLASFMAGFKTPPGAIGLAGQIAFAVVPLAQLK